MSICSVRPVLSLCMGDLRPFAPLVGLSLGDLRPFAPLPGSFWRYVTLPHFGPRFLPVFANFRGSGSRPRGLRFRPDQKNKKLFLPPPPRRANGCAAGTKKFPFIQKSRYA